MVRVKWFVSDLEDGELVSLWRKNGLVKIRIIFFIFIVNRLSLVRELFMCT